MKKAKDIRNKRIILFYITAIVFPSIILGILAFRGIRNDQALTEKEQARLLKNFSVEFKSLISSKFSDTQGLFQNYLGNKAIQSEDFFSDSAINGIVEEEHLIDNIFCLIDRSRISLNISSLLYVPDEYSAAGSIILAMSPPGMEEAWDMEFRLKDFPAAIDFYKKAKGKNPSKQIKAEILNSIARNQKKGLMFTEAVESYEEILSDCSDVYFRPGVPFACLSLLEICKIKSQQGEIDELEGYLEDLLRIMLGKNYYLSVSFYSNTMEVIKEYLDTVNNDNINSLLSDIKIQDAICKRLLNFAGNFSP